MTQHIQTALTGAILALSLAPTHLVAQTEIAVVPIPVDAATIDFSGVWTYQTSNHQVSGACPNGTPMRGELSIADDAGVVALAVASGAVCRPASMCAYQGGVKGMDLVVSNTDTVDDEGGTVTNAMRISFFSAQAGGGEVSARYVHPAGFECHWTHNIAIARPD